MSHRRRIVLNVEPAPAVDLPGLTAPVTVIPLEGEVGRKFFVFVLKGEERKLIVDPQVHAMAQALGNLVHPAQCALIVTPEGSSLSAYEIRAKAR